MASVTIKNIPEDLHLELKDLAKRGGRSLNQEILQQLRAAVSVIPTPEEIRLQLERLERFHQQLLASGYQPPSGEEIVRTIRADRNSH